MSNFSHPSGFLDLSQTHKQPQIALFGLPFDCTSSVRCGSREAPAHVRILSNALEDYSPYQKRDLHEFAIIDIGDLELPFGNPTPMIEIVLDNTRALLQHIPHLAMIGGEHLCAYPVFKAMLEHYPDLHILQLDAHTDLRTHYMGEPWSHASVMYHIAKLFDQPYQRIIHYGLRSGLQQEFDFAEQCRSCGAPLSTPEQRLHDLQQHLAQINAPLYLTLDLDVFDPSIMPGTGTPEAGGILFQEFCAVLELLQHTDLVGFDMVEYAPPYDPSGISGMLAAKVLRETLIVLGQTTSKA
ncbi:MAG: agmatinase [Myxococcota bacterium]